MPDTTANVVASRRLVLAEDVRPLEQPDDRAFVGEDVQPRERPDQVRDEERAR